MVQGRCQDAVSVYTAALIRDPDNTTLKNDRKAAQEAMQRLQIARTSLAEEKYVQAWRQVEIIEKVLPNVGLPTPL